MTIEERLEGLERESVRARRRNRRVLVVAGLSIAVCAVGVAAFFPSFVKAQPGASVEKEIRANRFTLVDESGRERGRLAVDLGDAGLFLRDEKGRHRASLMVLKDRSLLSLSSEKGRTHEATLSADNIESSLLLRDENGKVRAGLDVMGGGPRIWFRDEDGKLRAALEVDMIGPKLSLCDENGDRRAFVHFGFDSPFGPAHGPVVSLYDENGKVRAALGVDGTRPRLELFEANEKVRWSAP